MTGITLLIILSGLRMPKWQIPTPLLYVPYAAPKFAKTKAHEIPAKPKMKNN